MAIAYREDHTFNVTGFSKHTDGNYIVFLANSGNGAAMDVETSWLKQ